MLEIVIRCKEPSGSVEEYGDIRRTESRFKTLSPYELGKVQDDIKERLESLLRTSQSVLDKQVTSTCRVCDKQEIAYDSLPAGWGWRGGYKLCSKHLTRWDEK